MKRLWPKIGGAGYFEGLGVEFGVSRELLINHRSNTALGADLGEELANGAGAQTMEVFYPSPEAQVGDDLGRDFADGAPRSRGLRIFRRA